MATSTTSRNPFDLPELKYRLSRFVTVKDALSCALVSKTWTYDFVSAIWFKVDFNVHPLFAELSPVVIANHGHHIRVVKNAVSLSHVSALAHSTVSKLRVLNIETAHSTVQHLRAYMVIASNNTSLQFLSVFANSSFANKVHQSTYYVSAQAFIPSSVAASPVNSLITATNVLTTLQVWQLYLTHDDWITILEASPRLTKVSASMTSIIGTPTRSFQHTGVTLLAYPLKSIFPQEQTTTPSLLLYFPNLTTLDTWRGESRYEIPTARVKTELARCCSRITQYKLEEHGGSITSEFLTDIASNVSRLTIQLEHLTPETITAILLHQATLKKLSHFYYGDFDYDKEQVGPVSIGLQVTDEMMQQIPRRCSRLQRLNLHKHEMDMDIVEAQVWACKDLRKLRIRVKGLETQEKILRAIALWRVGCWVRWQGQATGATRVAIAEAEQRLDTDLSIEA
ncbi:hypothetical protein BGW39_009252 [Mortierella sp. 14UC]|nr:hypothetical protein BGW39_009252 [Mortierella sp. 14UC]